MISDELTPVGNTVLFKFLDETNGKSGMFSERSRSGLIIPKLQSTQKGERWAEVLAVGPNAQDVKVGEFILIEPLMWTVGSVYNDQKVWKTNPDKIMVVTTDINNTVNY